jgi:hypothetical protein
LAGCVEFNRFKGGNWMKRFHYYPSNRVRGDLSADAANGIRELARGWCILATSGLP